MNTCRQTGSFRIRSATVGLYCCVALSGVFYAETSLATREPELVTATPTPTPPRRISRLVRPAKYSQFPHDAEAHRISCNTCHKFPSDNWQKVRSVQHAYPDVTEYPKHESCLDCHRQQFFKGARPAICSICHTNPSASNSTRHAFPNPREIFDTTAKGKAAISDLAVIFPHDKHIEIVSSTSRKGSLFVTAAFVRGEGSGMAEESCSVCHQTYKPQGESKEEYFTPPPPKHGDTFWLKKGTFKTTPIAHTTCFTCHSADTGLLPAPENCAACHRLKPSQPTADLDSGLAALMKLDDKRILDAWRRRDSSGKFQHDFFAHVDVPCSSCHNVQTINTADPSTKKVSISACAVCHATPTSDDGGTLNLEADARRAKPAFQCVKCHITFGKLPIPESHTTAIAQSGK